MWLKHLRVDGRAVHLRIRGKTIAEIVPADTAVPPDGADADFGGRTAWPGLIDVHIHGAAGADTMDGDLAPIARHLAKNGVTAWVPTTMTAPLGRLRELTETLPAPAGARVLGFHLEGPFLSPEHAGAQNAEYLAVPSRGALRGFRNIRLLTVAPELPGAMELIAECAGAGMAVCIGHTGCDYETALRAADAGAVCLTHTFNVMPPLLHRAPGPIGAGLERGLYAQLICDGIHVHKAAVLALYRMFGADRVVLISDSMRAAGLADGRYDLGGQEMTVRDGVARTPDGKLAGSTASLLSCVKNAISFGIPEADAVKMATVNPARLLGLETKKGTVAPGYDADLLILDEARNPFAVWVEGERAG